VSAYRTPLAIAGRAPEAGAWFVPVSAKARSIVEEGAKSLGLTIQAVAAAPQGARLAVGKPRVALVDLYGGLHPTGWLRWIFDGQELPYAIVYPQELDKGGLAKKYDILVVPDAAIPNARSGVDGGMFRGRFDSVQPAPGMCPRNTAPRSAISARKNHPRTQSLRRCRRHAAGDGLVLVRPCCGAQAAGHRSAADGEGRQARATVRYPVLRAGRRADCRCECGRPDRLGAQPQGGPVL
jgi:hypothetical protein